jgi:hypothetical protein
MKVSKSKRSEAMPKSKYAKYVIDKDLMPPTAGMDQSHGGPG